MRADEPLAKAAHLAQKFIRYRDLAVMISLDGTGKRAKQNYRRLIVEMEKKSE